MYHDRVDYHVDSTIDAGQPIEHAATHIGHFLQWLILHDLPSPWLGIASLWSCTTRGTAR